MHLTFYIPQYTCEIFNAISSKTSEIFFSSFWHVYYCFSNFNHLLHAGGSSSIGFQNFQRMSSLKSLLCRERVLSQVKPKQVLLLVLQVTTRRIKIDEHNSLRTKSVLLPLYQGARNMGCHL